MQANRLVPLFCAFAFAVSAPVFADPPANKGKPDKAVQGSDHGKKGDEAYSYDDRYGDRHDDRYDDKDKSNHGQVTSECNHRANERNLKGQDRKEWVEWCQDRGARYQYDDKRYNGERTCYRKAEEKGLSGDKRRRFLDECLHKQYDGSRDHTYGEPRGKDVLGKGAKER